MMPIIIENICSDEDYRCPVDEEKFEKEEVSCINCD
jgi:hypothetical protein